MPNRSAAPWLTTTARPPGGMLSTARCKAAVIRSATASAASPSGRPGLSLAGIPLADLVVG